MTVKEINVVTGEVKIRELTTAEKNEFAKNQATDDDMLAELRRERDMRLLDTDFYALSDQTLSSDMKTYRQALRDITKTYSSIDAEGFAWPTKP